MSQVKEFLESYDISQYDRPSIAADIAVFSIGRKEALGSDYRRLPTKTLRLLLIRRAEQPFQAAVAFFALQAVGAVPG